MEEEEEEEKIRERSVEVMEVGESAVMWEGTDLPLLASQIERGYEPTNVCSLWKPVLGHHVEYWLVLQLL